MQKTLLAMTIYFNNVCLKKSSNRLTEKINYCFSKKHKILKKKMQTISKIKQKRRKKNILYCVVRQKHFYVC